MKDCKTARENFALLLYGELNLDTEEQLESHLDACADCRAALQREKSLRAAFDALEIAPPPSLLRECREDLSTRLADESGRLRIGWWRRARLSTLFLRPAGALALVAIGFFGARLMPSSSGAALLPRYVEPVSGGRVRIIAEETRQRVIAGPIEDQQIRRLLLEAAKDPSDPGLRAESVGILNTQAQAADVRSALISVVRHDQNAGVRGKAIQGLTPYTSEPEVRSALAQVLLSDSNPGLRTEAIDLLTRGGMPALSLDRQLVGTLQELMQRGEQVDYVRERCRTVLASMKASVETY